MAAPFTPQPQSVASGSELGGRYTGRNTHQAVLDHWSFFQIAAYDRSGNEVYNDRPRSMGCFLILLGHALMRVSPRGYRTYFKVGSVVWRMRCKKLPWRPF